MIKQKSSQVALVVLLTFAALTEEVKALPMFTTQTGMDCAGCHMQHMPKLNKFGRKFAASGMTISQHVSELNKTSDMDVNPSMLIKSKYARTWDKPDGQGGIKIDDTNDGDLSPVRMLTFSAGGRVSENIGAIVNLGWRKEEGDSISGKVTYVKEVEDGYWGIVAYTTPSFGPFSGMEFYNTGLYKPLRTFDMRIYSNANSSTRVGARSATGIQVYYDKDGLISEYDHFFITMGMYTPTQDNTQDNINMVGNILPFARGAYEYPIGDYNVILGAFAIVGGEHALDTEELRVKRETYGVDLQIEGEVFDKEASLILTNVLKNKVEFTGVGAQLIDHLEDIHNEAFSIEAAVSLTPEVVAKLGYMTFEDHFDYRYNGTSSALAKMNVKDLDYAINVGVDYGFTVTNTPMKLAVEYAWMNPTLDRVKNYQSFMVTLTLPF